MDGAIKNKAASERVYETLAAWIGGQRLPHAILLEGRSEDECSASALEIAKAAMCTGHGKPCGKCRDCIKLEKGVHPDLAVYEGEGKARSFHIDAVREIRSRAFIYPNEAPVKVFILKNAQDMTIQAQNALLKILEEPPPSASFILTCENKSALLETILSRVSALSLDAGKKEDAALDSQSVEGQNQNAAAGARALSLLLNADELGALAELARYEYDRTGFLGAMSGMRSAIEYMLLPGQAGNIGSDGSLPNVDLPQGVNTLRLLRITDIIDDVSYAAAGNGNLPLLGCAVCGRIREELAKS